MGLIKNKKLMRAKVIGREVRIPLLAAFVASGIAYLLLRFKIIAVSQLSAFDPWEALWAYSLTMAAFNITALSLLPASTRLVSPKASARLRQDVISFFYIVTWFHISLVPCAFIARIARPSLDVHLSPSIQYLFSLFALSVSIAVLSKLLYIMRELFREGDEEEKH